MARGFSKQERERIRSKLIEACKQNWTKYGYKKTSIDELCQQVSISKGAFYLFFESKEDLFCEVLCSAQEEIYAAAFQIMEKHRNKNGVAEALKFIYREYDKNNFLYQSNSSDFTILTNKISDRQLQKIQQSNNRNQLLFLNQSYLNFKVDKNMAISIIYALIMNIKSKDTLPYDHIAVFDYMVDCLVDDIYE